MIEVEVRCDECARVQISRQPERLGPLGAVEFAELELRHHYHDGQLLCSRCVLANFDEIIASIKRTWRRKD